MLSKIWNVTLALLICIGFILMMWVADMYGRGVL